MPAYQWRRLQPKQRALKLDHRMETGKIWHAPTHFPQNRWFHVTAACFEHRHHIGRSEERMWAFSKELLHVFRPPWGRWRGWCLLPNHYHVLAEVWVPLEIRKQIARLHGRNSHRWNVEEHSTGRQVFHRSLLKEIRSPAHWWSTLNYIHHNPVHHGYVDTWGEWPFSSAVDFLHSVPSATARAVWRKYPVTGMGRNWDKVEPEEEGLP